MKCKYNHGYTFEYNVVDTYHISLDITNINIIAIGEYLETINILRLIVLWDDY